MTSAEVHVQHTVEDKVLRGRPAGFSVEHMLDNRTDDAAGRTVMRKHCSEANAKVIVSACNRMTVRSLVQDLAANGWGVTVKSPEIGENDAETGESASV